MAKLEELKRGESIKGILPGQRVMVVDTRWYGTTALELTYKDGAGRRGWLFYAGAHGAATY